MKQRLSLSFFLLSSLLIVFTLSSCGQNAASPSDETVTQSQIDEQKAKEAEAQRLAEEERQKVEAAAKTDFVNVNVLFNYDSYKLDDQAKEILIKKIEWLNNNADIKLIIEGHCDERGTQEYNMALGQKRASETAKFLINSGISEDRIVKIISYGEEKPFVIGNTEEAWAQNRCAHFELTE